MWAPRLPGHTQRYPFSNRLDPLRSSNSRRRSAMPSFLGFVFATRWSSPSLHLGHPLWWPATTFATAACEAFQNDDAFLDLLSLIAKLVQHFVDVHLRSLPALVGSISSSKLRRWGPEVTPRLGGTRAGKGPHQSVRCWCSAGRGRRLRCGYRASSQGHTYIGQRKIDMPTRQQFYPAPENGPIYFSCHRKREICAPPGTPRTVFVAPRRPFFIQVPLGTT